VQEIRDINDQVLFASNLEVPEDRVCFFGKDGEEDVAEVLLVEDLVCLKDKGDWPKSTRRPQINPHCSPSS
jgi:hypothetical protein